MSEAVSTQTTIDKIKQKFLSGEILTSCGAAEKFITADLRRIITTLRRSKMDIVDRWVTSTTGKRYKEYFLREFTPKEKPVPDTVPPTSVLPISALPGPLVTALQEEQNKNMKGHQPTLF